MCDPATLAITAAVVSAAGSLQAGAAARSQGRYEAAIARQNAGLANNQAQDAIERGKEENLRRGRALGQLKGQQQAALAANGIDASFGSAATIAQDTSMLGAEDANTAYQNTLRETKGFEISAANYRSEAQGALMKGKAAQVGSYFGAASSLLAGASQYGKLKAGQ